MHTPVPRVAKSAPGPFYVRADYCIVCELCVEEAPDFMACDDTHGDSTCYFTKQPETLEETERALRATECCCVGAVAYEGDDPAILTRIAEQEAEEERRRQARILAKCI